MTESGSGLLDYKGKKPPRPQGKISRGRVKFKPTGKGKKKADNWGVKMVGDRRKDSHKKGIL